MEQKIKIGCGPESFTLTKIDYIFFPLLAIIGAFLIMPYLGTAFQYDDMLYMNISLNPTKVTWVLNRYGHIYFQKLFMWVAGDARSGAKMFWAFLFFATALLTYWTAKMLAGRKHYEIGILAVILMFSQPVYSWYAGCTFTDFTAMFFIALATFLYLKFLPARAKFRTAVLFIFGAVLFWAVKSKETGGLVGILLLGLGQKPDGKRSFKQFLSDISLVVLGAGAALLLLMTLDSVFLKDPLFSIRLSSFKGLIRFLDSSSLMHTRIHSEGHHVEQLKETRNWFSYFSGQGSPFLCPLILYFLAGREMALQNVSFRIRLAWMVPIFILFILNFMPIGVYIVPRYFAPVIPGVCVWAAQFFKFDISACVFAEGNKAKSEKLGKILSIMMVLIAFGVVVFGMKQVPKILAYIKLNRPMLFYSAAIVSMTASLLIMVSGISRKRGLGALFISTVCILFAIYMPLTLNIDSLLRKELKIGSEHKKIPYMVFGKYLRFDKDVKILVSKDIPESLRMLEELPINQNLLFNVYFNQNFKRSQFINATWEDAIKVDYTFGFLTFADWERIKNKYGTDQILQKYDYKQDSRAKIILLSKKVSPLNIEQ